ncbi:MAG TPA: VCBS repeat-containing protein, partial [Ignavibacteriaceae bacterium]
TGNPSLSAQIKFNSYPENISTVNNSDNSQSFLVSGNSFDGLSVLSYRNNTLKEIKVSQKHIFQNAQFIDLNSDGFEDIVALNSIENKLHLFFNNSHGDYNELRYLNISSDVLSLKVFDVNYDQFKDIIVSTTTGVIIYFGDASASFEKSVEVRTSYAVDKFIIGDFNHDGFFDINYLNVEEGIISTIFAKDFDLFYPEFIQKKQKGIVDVIPFFSKFVYGAAYLNSNGQVHIISSVSAMSEDQQLAIGIEPNLITSFDHVNNGITDIAFTDDYDKRLKIIIRNNAGLPERLFAVNLYEEHNKILDFSNSKSVKTFFLYSINKKIIESIEIDFEKFSFIRKFHYAEGPIKDLIIKADSKGDAELFILYSKNNNLNLQVITKTQINYNQKLYTNLSSNWFDPFLFFDDQLTIGYWQFESNYIKLNFLNFSDKDRKPVNELKLNRIDTLLVTKSNQSSSKSDLKYSAVLSNGEEILLATGGAKVKLFKAKNTKNGFRIQDKNQLFFGKTNSVFVYNSNLSALTEFKPAKTGNKLFVSNIFDDLELNNYNIQKLDQRNYHLIFTNIKSGNIEIRQLSR